MILRLKTEQVPGSDDEIHEFCTMKFGTEFPQFAKVDVNGETAEPLFAWLGTEKPLRLHSDIKNCIKYTDVMK